MLFCEQCKFLLFIRFIFNANTQEKIETFIVKTNKKIIIEIYSRIQLKEK